MFNPGQQNDASSNVSLIQTAQFFNSLSNSNTQSNSALNNAESNEVPQFAPSFLFGNQEPSKRRSFATPNKQLLPAGYGSPSILKNRDGTSISGKNVHWSPVLVREKSPEEKKLLSNRLSSVGTMRPASSSLWNGPPLRSLNEDVVGPPEKMCRLEGSGSGPLNISTVSIGNSTEIDRNGTRSNKESAEELVLGDQDEENIYWVTVFGFSPDQHQQILELFSRHGDIMAQKTPKQGNWMHIRYSSPIHAKQALTKNGMTFHEHMIGVVPCKDRTTLCDQEAVRNTSPLIHQAANNNLNGNSPMLDESSLLLNGSRFVPSTFQNRSNTLPSRARLSISSRAGMRPLNSSALSDLDRSMDSSFLQQSQRSTGEDSSFIGKLWNIFTNPSGTV